MSTPQPMTCLQISVLLSGPHDNKSISSLALLLEEYFLDCLENQSLTAFETVWSPFLRIVEAQSHVLDEDTHALINKVATSIAAIASSVLEIEDTATAIEHQLMKEIDETLVQDAPRESPSFPDTVARYIQPAYDWLLHNLHNPYPSSAVRESISRSTGCSRKDIDNWFIDVRKRIGWNALRKTHFSNKRNAIVDAARLFFSTKSKSQCVDSRVASAFTKVRQATLALYSKRLFESGLVSQIVSEPHHAMQSPSHDVTSCYPSPSPSPCRSPVPPHSVDCSPDAVTPDVNTRRTQMPLQLGTPTSPSSPSSYPELLAALPDLPRQPFPPTPDTPLSMSSPLPMPSGSRKRRLSEGATVISLKRLRGNDSDSPTYVVSEPLSNSMTYDVKHLDDWFQQAYTQSIVTDLHEPTTNLDVELFDYSTMHLGSFSDISTGFITKDHDFDSSSISQQNPLLAPIHGFDFLSSPIEDWSWIMGEQSAGVQPTLLFDFADISTPSDLRDINAYDPTLSVLLTSSITPDSALPS